MEEQGQIMNITHCKNYDELYNILNKDGMYIDDEDGYKYTFKNNLLHSYNGKPAVEMCDGFKGWYRNGLYHRLYGPAIECSDGDKRWFLFGIQYYEDEYNEIMKNVPLFYWKNRDNIL